MNCGVSTAPWVSVSIPVRARVEPSAGGGVVDLVARRRRDVRGGHASGAVGSLGAAARPTARACPGPTGAAAGSRSRARDRCARPRSVAMRPCGVRSMNPRRSRNGSWTSSMVSVSSDRTAAERRDPDRSRRRTSGRSRPAACGPPSRAPRRRSPSRRIASRAVASSTWPSPWTSALSRTRLSSRLTIRGCPAAASGDGLDGGRLDRDAQDLRRALDDLGELLVGVEVEPVRGPEPVAQRGADAAGTGRRADDRERLQAQPQRPGRRPLADHHVERVVLHRRIEDLLDRPVEPMDLVDEQDVALVERGQDRREVAGALDRPGPRCTGR